jgi:hypothetical protein
MNIEIAKKLAIDSHKSINQKYNGHSYDYHLEMAEYFAKLFIHLIPEKDRNNVISGCWCHDIIEDVSSVTFNDLKKSTNIMVAEIAYACTNEKGRNRAERANDKYYKGIRNTKYATFVKLCDRLANVKYSTNGGSRMADLYRKENYHFKKMLKRRKSFWKFFEKPEYIEMWDLLEELLKK